MPSGERRKIARFVEDGSLTPRVPFQRARGGDATSRRVPSLADIGDARDGELDRASRPGGAADARARQQHPPAIRDVRADGSPRGVPGGPEGDSVDRRARGRAARLHRGLRRGHRCVRGRFGAERRAGAVPGVRAEGRGDVHLLRRHGEARRAGEDLAAGQERRQRPRLDQAVTSGVHGVQGGGDDPVQNVQGHGVQMTAWTPRGTTTIARRKDARPRRESRPGILAREYPPRRAP